MTAAELLPIFREQFPEFNDPGGTTPKTDTEVLLLLNSALLIHALCSMATVYLAAHLCVINTDSGVGGSGGSVDGGGAGREVASETAKSISTTFKTMSADGDGNTFYSSTPYGRMYIVLRDQCPSKRFSVRVA